AFFFLVVVWASWLSASLEMMDVRNKRAYSLLLCIFYQAAICFLQKKKEAAANTDTSIEKPHHICVSSTSLSFAHFIGVIVFSDSVSSLLLAFTAKPFLDGQSWHLQHVSDAGMLGVTKIEEEAKRDAQHKIEGARPGEVAGVGGTFLQAGESVRAGNLVKITWQSC
ncbi:hypothetical protein ACJX0J_021374, partial [Zea mays]